MPALAALQRKQIRMALHAAVPVVLAFLLLHLSSRRPIVLDWHNDATALAFSPRGDLLATGGTKWVKTWDWRRRKIVHYFEDCAPDAIAYSPDGSVLALGHHTPDYKWGRDLYEWSVDLRDSQSKRLLQAFPVRLDYDEWAEINTIAFSPDGSMLACGTVQPQSHSIHHVFVWHVKSGTQKWLFKEEGDGINALSFSADSRFLAVGSSSRMSGSGHVRIFDAQTGKIERQLQGCRPPLGCGYSRGRTMRPNTVPNGKSVAFLPDGRLVTGGDGGATVWNSETGASLFTLSSSGDIITCSLEGEHVAIGGTVYNSHQEIEIWHIPTRRRVRVMRPQPNLHSFVFAPDGRALATSSGNSATANVLQVWRLK